MQEMQEASLGWEDPLEEEMATHSSILAGKSHGHRSLAGYSPWGRTVSDTTERLTLFWKEWAVHAVPRKSDPARQARPGGTSLQPCPRPPLPVLSPAGHT